MDMPILSFRGEHAKGSFDEDHFDDLPPDETFKRYVKTGSVEAVRIDEPFRVLTPSGWQEMEGGDYLVRADDDVWGVSRERFDDTHSETDELGLPVAPDDAPPAPEDETVVDMPDLVGTMLVVAKEFAPRPVFDFMLYPLASPGAVEDALRGLEGLGKISRIAPREGRPGRFWSQEMFTVRCERCGFEHNKVPAEGMPCPNCARSLLVPEDK